MMTNTPEPKQDKPQAPVPDKRIPIGPLDCATHENQFGRLTVEYMNDSIYAKALRHGAIKVVGYCNRTRGHGGAGGRVYAAGDGKQRAEYPHV